MVDRTGLETGVTHGKSLERAVDQTMKIHFPRVIVMSVNDPVGVINPSQPVQGPYFRFNGHTPIKGAGGFDPSLEVLVQLKVRDHFAGLGHSSPDAESQTDLTPSPFLDHLLDGPKHFRVRFASHNAEPML